MCAASPYLLILVDFEYLIHACVATQAKYIFLLGNTNKKYIALRAISSFRGHYNILQIYVNEVKYCKMPCCCKNVNRHLLWNIECSLMYIECPILMRANCHMTEYFCRNTHNCVCHC